MGNGFRIVREKTSLFLIFYFFIIACKLLFQPLPFYDWDEAIYAEVGREMIEKKSIIPLWQGKYWLDKPPLVMLLYGLIAKIFFFIPPEISLRFFNLFLNLLFFIILFRFSLRILKSKNGAFFTLILTFFTPLFIQRAYTINMDIFLALGWLGYFYFYHHFWLSVIFLSLAVFSKSLLGFYPLIIIFLVKITAQIASKKNCLKNFLNDISYKRLILQLFLLSLWYFLMIFRFGRDFIFQHFYESHLKRVIASIEFHFGERLFYLFEIYRQLNIFFYFSLVGLILIIYLWRRKQLVFKQLIYLNLFLPWFLFLNVTKTKIFWYVYPLIPQFSLYVGFLVSFLEKKISNKKIQSLIFIIFILGIFYWGLFKNNFLNSSFSSQDKYYQMAKFSKNICDEIYFLPEKNHRQSISELEKMGLTITTTKWWGGHPGLVYYTNNKIIFVYDEKDFFYYLKNKRDNQCFSFLEKEIALNQDEVKIKLIKKFEDVWLVK